MQEVRSRRAAHVILRAIPGGSSSDHGLDDAKLIEGIRAGDERIATQLYRRLVPVVDRTLYRVFGRREPDHDDLVQSALEQVVFTLSTRRFAGACSLNTWASTIASHVGLAALRARRRERRVFSPGKDLEGAAAGVSVHRDPEHELGVRDQIERARKQLVAMDPKKAEALFLHDVLGHELAELAAMAGISIAAAQSRLVRARREFVERMRCDVSLERAERGQS
jgi:RNA polymerase sigma-70 factor (ECF subfamily)